MAACHGDTFVDVTWGATGPTANNVYAVTSTGVLAMFDDARIMDMWVKVSAPAASQHHIM